MEGIIVILILVPVFLLWAYTAQRKQMFGISLDKADLLDQLPEATKGLQFASEDGETAIGIDPKKRHLFAIRDGDDGPTCYKKADILECAIVEDSNVIAVSHRKGSIGRAIVGGALLGGVGAIAGAASSGSVTTSHDIIDSLILRISVRDMENPTLDVSFKPPESITRDSPQYVAARKSAADWFSRVKNLAT